MNDDKILNYRQVPCSGAYWARKHGTYEWIVCYIATRNGVGFNVNFPDWTPKDMEEADYKGPIVPDYDEAFKRLREV